MAAGAGRPHDGGADVCSGQVWTGCADVQGGCAGARSHPDRGGNYRRLGDNNPPAGADRGYYRRLAGNYSPPAGGQGDRRGVWGGDRGGGPQTSRRTVKANEPADSTRRGGARRGPDVRPVRTGAGTTGTIGTPVRAYPCRAIAGRRAYPCTAMRLDTGAATAEIAGPAGRLGARVKAGDLGALVPEREYAVGDRHVRQTNLAEFRNEIGQVGRQAVS